MRTRRWWIGGLAMVAGIGLGVVVGVLVGSGSSASDASVLAAVVTVLGVLATVVANQFLGARSEQRLRLDAALEAGKLLTPVDGHAVSAAVAASSLLALTDLGREKLAVAILVDLWRRNSVSPEVAVLVVDKALATDDEKTVQMAAEVLCENAAKLDPTAPAHWPSILEWQWLPHAPELTKILLVEALIGMCTSSGDPSLNALRSLVVRIVSIHEQEEEGQFRHCLAGFVGAIAPALDRQPARPDGSAHRGGTGDPDGPMTFFDGHGYVTAGMLRRIGDTSEKNGDSLYAEIISIRQDALAEWARCCRRLGADPSHGELAATPRHELARNAPPPVRRRTSALRPLVPAGRS